MNIKSAIMVTLAMLLLACGKQDDIPPPAATESKMTPAEEPVIENVPVEETQAMRGGRRQQVAPGRGQHDGHDGRE